MIKYALDWFPQTDFQMNTLVIFTLCIVISDIITKIVDAETKIDLLILVEIKK